MILRNKTCFVINYILHINYLFENTEQFVALKYTKQQIGIKIVVINYMNTSTLPTAHDF